MRWKIVATTIFVFTSFFGIGSQKPSSWSQRTPQSQGTVRKGPLPIKDYTAYELLFKRVARLEHEAEIREKEGKDGQSLRLWIGNTLALSPEQALTLRDTALSCLSKSSELDQRANEIISQFRAQYTKGHFDSRKAIPQAPFELQSMQVERDGLFLQGKVILQSSFGPTEFAMFEMRMQELMKEIIVTQAAGKRP